jgi:alpha-D-ribose 1-methylphosphonate 5-triphosphate synthase subunit PhnL
MIKRSPINGLITADFRLLTASFLVASYRVRVKKASELPDVILAACALALDLLEIRRRLMRSITYKSQGITFTPRQKAINPLMFLAASEG